MNVMNPKRGTKRLLWDVVAVRLCQRGLCVHGEFVVVVNDTCNGRELGQDRINYNREDNYCRNCYWILPQELLLQNMYVYKHI